MDAKRYIKWELISWQEPENQNKHSESFSALLKSAAILHFP